MARTQPRTALPTLVILLLAAGAFIAGYRFNDTYDGLRPVYAAAATDISRTSGVDTTVSLKPVQLFQEALGRVQAQYYNPGVKPDGTVDTDVKPPDAEALTYAAIRGMLASLDDPYTRFMDPKEYAEFTSDNRGQFGGIGATLNMVEIPGLPPDKHGEGTSAPIECPTCGTIITSLKHYRTAVVDTLPNSPAQKAGLQPDDQIMAVDGKATDGMVLSEVTDLIRGAEGKPVTITIARKGGKPFDVTIVRAKIEVSPVESKVLDGTIGYLRLYQFNQKTVEDSRAALLDFEKQNVKGTIIDLRGNPGGLLDECIRLASMLLPADKTVIVSTRERTQVKEQKRDPREKQMYTRPLVVLVNRRSASASEILSGALKDYGRAIVVGEPTYGKALVQTVETLGDRNKPSAMAITIAHYYTPNGTDIARDPKTGKGGVDPNVIVKLDENVKRLDEKDNQAREAIRILKEQIAKAGK